MQKQIIVAVIASFIPAVALAGPVVGLGYSDVGLTGHAGRPGIQFNAGNVYHNKVIASGAATFARGYYGFNADLGKLIPAGGVSFEPYLSLGFLSLNYNQQVAGGIVTTHPSPYLTEFTQSYYTQQQSIQDFYGLAGVNLSIPISNKVGVGIGGGFGHTLSSYGGSGNGGGSVYTGDIIFGGKIAKHITASLDVSYTHVPGASLTSYGAGLAYHF